MSSIYGDSIFESNDIIINRLFETIDNDSKLFDNFVNESVVDSVKNFINKIKELVGKLIEKFKEAIRKVKSYINEKYLVAKWKNDLMKKKAPFTISTINYKNVSDFYEKLNIYINDGKSMLNNIDNISIDEIKDNDALLRNHMDKYELSILYRPDIKKLLFTSNISIYSEEKKEEFIEKDLNKLIKDSVNTFTIVEKELKSLTNIKNSLSTLEKKYDYKNKDFDRDLKEDNKYRELGSYYYSLIRASERLLKIIKCIYNPNFVDNTVASN